MATRVLLSGTSYADALYLNILHFDRAIRAETRIAALEHNQTTLKQDMEKRLLDFEKQISDLKQENEILKRRLEEREAFDKRATPGES